MGLSLAGTCVFFSKTRNLIQLATGADGGRKCRKGSYHTATLETPRNYFRARGSGMGVFIATCSTELKGGQK